MSEVTGNYIIADAEHYFAEATVSVVDLRKGIGSCMENFTVYYECKSDNLQDAENTCKNLLKNLGYTMPMISNVIIKQVSLNASEMWQNAE